MSYKLNVDVCHRGHEITSTSNSGNKMHLRENVLCLFFWSLSRFPKALFTMYSSLEYVLTEATQTLLPGGEAGACEPDFL